MEINIKKLIKSSIKFERKLRFPLHVLTINLGKKRKDFSNFISNIIETGGGHKFKTQLTEILIDTGNEAEYIIMSAYYLSTFKEKIKEIEMEKQVIEDFRGNKRLTEVSTEIFEFKIFNATFNSRIGFTYKISINALDIINLGINAISQFLNILFPANDEYYYFCNKV